ncbi:MAG TPA: sodium:proton antiporter [Candidatus Binatia bacterium]
MSHHTLISLAAILVLGITAQWIAWRLRMPSILLLLASGLVAGPVLGWLDPDELFGELLLPLVSLSVAVILYEGGLNLKLRELRDVGRAFFLLVTVGVAVSWVTGALAARWLLGLEWAVASLLGAILVVTGPTVIGPMLRHLRLRGKVGALLKWEGIIIDPIGATLAVLAFTVVQADVGEGFGRATIELASTLVIGVAIGGVAAAILIVVLSRYWVPDTLHNPVSLMLMIAAFTTANVLQEESGLLAVTVMGIVLANQTRVSIRHVVEFKESLTVLLVSGLFVVLGARLRPEALAELGWASFAFVAVLILIARPAGVLLSTWRSTLTWQERAFLCCMAPRGIVAAAISSVFALSLVSLGYAGALAIVPVTFLVVFVTVLLYGSLAGVLARRLGLAQANPQGVLFVGADPWVRAVASALHDEQIPVFLVDTHFENIRDCRMSGLPCLYGSALAEETREAIDYSGLGRMLAVTSNDEVNSLACMRYAEDFGRQEIYQLPFAPRKEGRHEAVPAEHRGRFLFGQEHTHRALSALAGPQPTVKKTPLTAEFDFAAFQARNAGTLLPLFVLKPDGKLQVATVEGLAEPQPGDVVVSLVLAAVASPRDEAQERGETSAASQGRASAADEAEAEPSLARGA